jgi:hypothetical protein
MHALRYCCCESSALPLARAPKRSDRRARDASPVSADAHVRLSTNRMPHNIDQKWVSPGSPTKSSLSYDPEVQLGDPHSCHPLLVFENRKENISQPSLQPEKKITVDHPPPCGSYASTVMGDTAIDCDDTQPDAVRAIDGETDHILHKQVEAVNQRPYHGRTSIAARCGVEKSRMRALPGPVHPSHMLHLGQMSMAFNVPLDRAVIAYKHAESILRSDLAPYTHRVLDLVAMDGSKHTILPSQMIRTIKELTARKFNGTTVERDDLSGWTQLLAVLERGLRTRSVLRLATLKVYRHHEAMKARSPRLQEYGSLHNLNPSLEASQQRGGEVDSADDIIQESHFACPFDINNAVASAYETKKHKEKYRRWRNQGRRLHQISETVGLGLLVVAGSGLEKM